VYTKWGFKTSPFDTSPLPSNELGAKLLVGRDQVLNSVIQRVRSGRKACTIEGLNGVGKTSIVNVASYKMLIDHIVDPYKPLYIPCRKIFQIRDDQDSDDFVFDVLLEIAQTLMEKIEDIRQHGYNLDTSAINRWINQSENVSYQLGAMGFGGGRTVLETNSVGFEKNGFRKIVLGWLNKIFPSDGDGAIVCTIDNLEILQSSIVARKKLENLRDEIFSMPGVRWILCGSLGIVRGILTSPRLDGYVHDPIEVGEITNHYCRNIIATRMDAYKFDNNDPYLPITSDSFEKLYNILNGNIRSALTRADDFCHWIGRDLKPESDADKNDLFDRWLNIESKAHYEAARAILKPITLKTFKKACERHIISVSDHEDFDIKTPETFRKHIKILNEAGLLSSTEDETDKRRKTVTVTAKGWMVNYLISQQNF
jgi:hypothetical protein